MEYAPTPWPSPRTGWRVLRWEFSNSGKPPKVRERSSKAAFHHILHIEGRHHLPGRCRAGPTTTSRAERSSACSSRPCVVVGAEPAVRRRRGAGRASLWARSRPCVVVGAEPAMRRPAGLLDLRRRCAAARRGVRGVLRRASGAQFFIARRGRGSGRRSTAPTTAWSRVPRRAARRPLTASRRTSPRRPRAVLLRCSALLHQRAAAAGAAFYHLDVFAGNP